MAVLRVLLAIYIGGAIISFIFLAASPTVNINTENDSIRYELGSRKNKNFAAAFKYSFIPIVNVLITMVHLYIVGNVEKLNRELEKEEAKRK